MDKDTTATTQALEGVTIATLAKSHQETLMPDMVELLQPVLAIQQPAVTQAKMELFFAIQCLSIYLLLNKTRVIYF